MVWKRHPYEDIPGTYVFDGKRAHPSYAINKLFYSLNTAENRERFERDPVAYCDEFDVKGEYREAILNHDFLGLLRLGANIYFMAKMAIPRGVSVQDAGAAFQGISSDKFKQNLLDKGQGLEEKLKARGGYWRG